jgi:hypothetical protein
LRQPDSFTYKKRNATEKTVTQKRNYQRRKHQVKQKAQLSKDAITKE